MFKDYKVNRYRGFRGIVSDVTDELLAQGYVPDMENITIDIDGIAQNLPNPTKQVYLSDAAVWQATHAYYKYAVRQPTTSNGHLYYATSTGTSGGTEPTFPTTVNGTVSDNDMGWKELCTTTDEIKQIYRWSELDVPVLMVQTYRSLPTPSIAVIDTTNWIGIVFSHSYCPVSFASASVPGKTRLYIMSTSSGLWWYGAGGATSAFNDVSNPGSGVVDSGTATSGTATTLVDSTKDWTPDALINQILNITLGTGIGQSRKITDNDATSMTVATWDTTPDATSTYSITGYGKPPLTQHILVWNNRLWAYGNLVESDETTNSPMRIRCSSITSKPEPCYDDEGNVLAAPGNTGYDFWDETYGYDDQGVPIPQGNHFDLVTPGYDTIRSVHSYGQMLGVSSKDAMMFISGTSDTTFQTSIIYQGHDGAVINDMVEADALYYLSRNGLMAFTTPIPTSISKAINSVIIDDLIDIDDDFTTQCGSTEGYTIPQNLTYFKQRLYFLLNDKIWAYHLERKTWEKYSYSSMRSLYASDHLYMGDTTGKVWKLDVAGSGFTTWTLYTPHINFLDPFIQKIFDSMVVYYKVPTASSTLVSEFRTDYSTTGTSLTNKEMYSAGLTGEMKDYSQRTISGSVGTIQYKFSGTGEVKLFGYDVTWKPMWRKKR